MDRTLKHKLLNMSPLLAIFLSGCVLGPGSLKLSRNNYNAVVQETAREELLLNLVRLRYNQSPEFMSVPSITGQFQYEAGLKTPFGFTDKDGSARLLPQFNLAARSKPTIVYTPEQGQEFNRRLLSPISAETLDLLGSKGWRIDRVLRLTVRNINDVDNASSAGGPTPLYKPEFEEFRYFTDLMRQLQTDDHSFEVASKIIVTDDPIQVSDAISIENVDGEDLVLAAKSGYRFRVAEDQKFATLWKVEEKSQVQMLRFAENKRTSEEFLEICRILELDPKLTEFRIKIDTEGQLVRPNSRRSVDAPSPLRKELIVSTRSLKETMYYMSHVVDVPQSHLDKGYVRQTLDPATNCPYDWKEMIGDLFQVHHGILPPLNAAVRIHYRGHWFYIKDDDLNSKATFNLLLELFNLEIRAGGGAQIPLLTI